MRTSTCKHCGELFNPKGNNPGVFCQWSCKSAWQRTQKPVTREWLEQKYVHEGMGCPEIARLVNRDPKSVFNWLRDFGIPTRPRGADERQHFERGHTMNLGRKASSETREKIRQAAIRDGRVPFDPKVGPPMRGKRGAETTNWKGGITPERQALYSTPAWAEAVKIVWAREQNRCQRCGLDYATVTDKRRAFVVHHIASFKDHKELRCELSNLVLLCKTCHLWTHSKANKDRQFLL